MARPSFRSRAKTNNPLATTMQNSRQLSGGARMLLGFFVAAVWALIACGGAISAIFADR